MGVLSIAKGCCGHNSKQAAVQTTTLALDVHKAKMELSLLCSKDSYQLSMKRLRSNGVGRDAVGYLNYPRRVIWMKSSGVEDYWSLN